MKFRSPESWNRSPPLAQIYPNMCMRPLSLLANTTFPVDKSHLSEQRPRLLPTPLKLRQAKSRLSLKVKSPLAMSRLAKLQQAKLQQAKLQQAKLQQAKLQQAKLQQAKLQQAKLQQAKLQQAM